MRIIVMSDSHSNRYALEKIFEKTADSGSIFVHLGDGERELDLMRAKYPSLDIRHAAGNCDYGSLSPDFDIIRTPHAKLLFTHGHNHGVKYGTEGIKSLAEKFGCSVALFGHTHCRCCEYTDGIYIYNPGSCSCPRDFTHPSYGFIDVTDKGIFINTVDL